jgi:cytochrome b561
MPQIAPVKFNKRPYVTLTTARCRQIKEPAVTSRNERARSFIMAEPSLTSHREIGYTPVAKILHWFIFAILIGQFAVAWSMPHIGRNTVPGALINLHFSLGVLVLGLAIVRLAWRWTHPEPTPLDGLPPWQTNSARAVHLALYLLLFILPVLGWTNASFRGFTVSFFGLFELPALVQKGAAGFNWTGDVHAFSSNYVLLAVVGLHILVVLHHALIRKDKLLQRMLPSMGLR